MVFRDAKAELFELWELSEQQSVQLAAQHTSLGRRLDLVP